MKYEDLRNIRHSEYEATKLTTIAPDTFEKAHAELASITNKVYELKDPFSEDARDLIDETNVIKQTLHEIYIVRLNKILDLAVRHAQGDYYDRDELKRMIPNEKTMFEQITASIEQCRDILFYNKPQTTQVSVSQTTSDRFGNLDFESPSEIADEGSGPLSYADETAGPNPQALPVVAQKGPEPITHPCALVRVLEDMESFMGVDGRIYSLSKGDIVTLPERNAAVLSERNIVLNINLCK
jgi:DNA replication factor GINS